jgi:dienelactone hydrolase
MEEDSKATLGSKVFSTLGLGAVLPPSPGPVGSFRFRVPGGVLVQVFFPVTQAAKNAARDQRRHAYRKTVIAGLAKIGNTSANFWNRFLASTLHPAIELFPKSDDIAGEEKKLPVVFFSHGLNGNGDIYCKPCSDLASSGYIVIAMEHEDGSGSYAATEAGKSVEFLPALPKGSTRDMAKAYRLPMLEKREAEVMQTVNFFSQQQVDAFPQLAGFFSKINTEQFVLSGHSFGACAAMKIVRNNANRFKGVLLWDIWSFPLDLEKGQNGIPICSIMSDVFAHNEDAPIVVDMIANSDNVWGSFYIKDTVHTSFSDTPFWMPNGLAKKVKIRGKLDRVVTAEVIFYVSKSFLSRVVNDADGSGFEADMLKDRTELKEFRKGVTK